MPETSSPARLSWTVVALLAVVPFLPAAQDPRPASTPARTIPPRAHDPSIAEEGGVYYVFTTGRRVSLLASDDGMATWRRVGSALADAPTWTGEAVPGSRDYYWAPAIVHFNGLWHLYYSVSTFGRNRSAIGLATRKTLDPDAPEGWDDRGIAFESEPGDDYNAIDPDVILDEDGRPWLAFGSFWGGLQLVPLDPETGKPAPDAKPVTIAARPDGGDAIEAPCLIHIGEFYYLFASFDRCCRGVESTYNIRVGRSDAIAGPYLDREGRPMLEGGGTRIKSGTDRWPGPGHCAVLRDGETDWLVYHAYDGEDEGIPRLRIEAIRWDDDGWPIATGRSPLAADRAEGD